MESMYDKILNLPLFKGVSYNRISDIVGNTKFHFLKYSKDEPVAHAAERCTHVKFILSGAVRLTITNADNRFQIEQTLSAPDVICPEFLFGRATSYPGEIVTLEETSIMQVSKADYIEILHTDRVFLYNFLNLLSRNAQKSVDGIMAVTTGTLPQRIAFWIMALTQPDATDITLTCRHRDLYALFGVQRSTFISTLDQMSADGLIEYSKNELHVISRQGMINLLYHPSETDLVPYPDESI